MLAISLAGTGISFAETAENKIDTEALFGFLTGTDIGEPGDKELESTTVGRFGKRSGSYRALSQSLALEYTPIENLRLELGAAGGYHDIKGVDQLDDLRRGSLQGLSLEMRYRLLSREQSGVGLSLLAEPHWARSDETNGQPVNQYGSELAILIDKELVPDRIMTAFNALYEPEVTQSRKTGAWSHAATVGIGAALMAQIKTGFFIGGEGRYLRSYESIGIDRFAGHALFLGPNIFFRPGERWRVTLSWAIQIAGRAVAEPGRLDLTNFERNQIRLRIGHEF